MADVTYHVVLLFIRDDTGELIAEEGQEGPSEHSAMSRARAMIGRKAGAIAFRRTGDPQIGDFEDAVILSRYGETPEDLPSDSRDAESLRGSETGVKRPRPCGDKQCESLEFPL